MVDDGSGTIDDGEDGSGTTDDVDDDTGEADDGDDGSGEADDGDDGSGEADDVDDAAATDDVAAAARARVLDAHAGFVEGVVAAADAVAAAWDGAEASDREAVVAPLRAELESAGLLDRAPAVLADAVAAAGYDLPAEPVAAPPYVVVTGRGPVLRATVADGRLVVVLGVFRVERDPVRYVRDGEVSEDVVEVSFVSE